MHPTVLILGACGQIGTELTLYLRERYGRDKVIASDIREGGSTLMESGPFKLLDAMNSEALTQVVKDFKIDQIYLMAAMLSATGEKFPARAWELNMTTLFNVLDLAKDKKISRAFWPSSIAVFGPSTPKENTPQQTVMEPTTVYGISKQAGERWCEYYFNKYGVDVRSVRYPGLISWKTQPGGGTTDYAVDIYHKALADHSYTSFLEKGTRLPMMYMDDAIRATVSLMETDASRITVRSSYNLAGMSFAPEDMETSIQKHLPDFSLHYQPDFRQAIADSWPSSIDDSVAQTDWGWQAQFDLETTTDEMLTQLERLAEEV